MSSLHAKTYMLTLLFSSLNLEMNLIWTGLQAQQMYWCTCISPYRSLLIQPLHLTWIVIWFPALSLLIVYQLLSLICRKVTWVFLISSECEDFFLAFTKLFPVGAKIPKILTCSVRLGGAFALPIEGICTAATQKRTLKPKQTCQTLQEEGQTDISPRSSL